jgi:hypothetical protein
VSAWESCECGGARLNLATAMNAGEPRECGLLAPSGLKDLGARVQQLVEQARPPKTRCY